MSNNSKIKVLCVEDEQDILDNISEILTDEGFEVFKASGGEDAIEIFLDSSPDIIVSDIMMPEVSGYDLLKIIRENKSIPNNNVPFIFLTALSKKEDTIKGIDLSANDYLIKPIDFDLLIAKIKEKSKNAKKIKNTHNKNIDNLKDQVSTIMPAELSQYVNLITDIVKNLKVQPYGPLPHKKYLEDINKIYINSIKLKTVINNFLNGSVVTNNLDIKEEILDPVTFIEEFISQLKQKFRNKIKFDSAKKSFPKIKIDKSVISEALRKILSILFKADNDSEATISLTIDHLGQIIFIFYLKSSIKKSALKNSIEKAAINKILEKQGCNFELAFKNSETNVILYIPAYRVIRNN